MFDILIIGGGMVGASLAIALAPLKLKLGLIEAVAPHSQQQPSYDDRSVALSYGSQLIYHGMGIWQHLQDQAQPIQHIHISDQGHFGATRLNATVEGVPALGYVVENRHLGQTLYQALAQHPVSIFMPAHVQQVEPQDECVHITLHHAGETKTLTTRLIIVADGANSSVRDQLGIHVTQYDYGQSAIIANVTTSKPHQQRAYERFTPQGPLALLPLTQQRYSLVWTRTTSQVTDLLTASDTHFLHTLQETFGYRQGLFTQVGKRTSYPLTLIKSNQDVAKRAVIIGNASHTLHPVAGQGLNLSLRDIAVLADQLAEAVKAGEDIGNAALLARYSAARQTDYRATLTYTDSLVRIFSNETGFLGHLRAAGLVTVDRIAPIRHWLARKNMGLHQRQARLARGVELRV